MTISYLALGGLTGIAFHGRIKIKEEVLMYEKPYDELGFTDDFLFCYIMLNNEDLCAELVEMITGRKVKEIIHSETQKSISMTYDGKGVRFDVYFEDEDSVVYDIEMQTAVTPNLSKRIRYYQGMIDLNILSRGADYRSLKESYIIFICTFDAFGKGRHVYTFEETCLEDSQIKLDDGTHKIFLCAGSELNDCSDKMKDFLDYVAGKETGGSLSKRLRDEVEKSREHEEWRIEYMTLLEKYREKYEQGIAEGEARGRAEGEKERKKMAIEIESLRAEIEKLKKSAIL